MNEEKDPKSDGTEQGFSEFANRSSPEPTESGSGGGSFLRGCGIALGVVALIFFFIVGTCFLS